MTALADGAYYICVTAKDAANNTIAATNNNYTFTVKTNAPTATLSGTPASQSNIGTLGVTVGGAGVVEYQYALLTGAADCSSASYGAWVPVATIINASTGADGTKLLCVTGRDAVANAQAVPTSYAWTKDTIAPTAVLSGTPANPSNVTTLAVTVGGAGVTDYQYDLISGAADCSTSIYGAWTAVGVNITEAIGADGPQRLCVISRDLAGNVQSAPTTYFWVKDTVPPIASLSGTPADPSSTTTLAVTVGGVDVVEYQFAILTGAANCSGATYGGWTVVGTNITSAAGVDGNKRLCVKGRDIAGNAQVTPSEYAWVKDSTPPGAFSITGPATPTNNVTPTVTWNTSTGATGYDLFVGTSSGCVSPLQTYTGLATTSKALTGLPHGTYYVCMKSKDAANNITVASNDGYTFNIDTILPVVAIDSHATVDAANATSVAVSGTCSEPGRTVTLGDTVSGSATCMGGLWTANLNYSAAPNGTLTLTANHTDAAGNNAVQASITFEKQIMPTPGININDVVINNANKTSVPISGYCSEPGRTITIGGAVSTTTTCTGNSWTKNIDYSGVADGTVLVTADISNYAGTPAPQASRNLLKDTVSPTVAINNAAINLANQASVTLTGTCSEHGQLVSITGATSFTTACNSGTWSAIRDLSGLSEGNVALTATLPDAAGNTGTANRTLVKDTVPPSVNAGANKQINVATTQDATTGGASTYLWEKVTGPGNAIFGTPTNEDTTIAANADGTYILRLTATDASGNSASATMRMIWDTTAPVVYAMNAPSGMTSVAALNVRVLGLDTTVEYAYKIITGASNSCNTTGYSAWRPISTPITDSLTALPIGPIRLCIVGKDIVGNEQVKGLATAYDWAKQTAICTGTNPDREILDSNTMTDYLNVNGTTANVTSSFRVVMNINHTYISDLKITLKSPSGTSVVLHNNSGGSSDDIIGTYPTTLSPYGSLSNFIGQPLAGSWSLTISDNYAQDPGNLNNWYITDAVNFGCGSDKTGPLAPTFLSLVPSSGQIATTWTPAIGGSETGYVLVRNANSPPTWTPTDGSSTTTGVKTGGTVLYVGANLSYTDTGLTNGTLYYYAVYAYDTAKTYTDPIRKFVNAGTLGVAPMPPVEFVAESNDRRLDLTWAPGGGSEQGFLLVRNTSAVTWTPTDGTVYDVGPNSGHQILFVGSNLDYIDANLINGSTYYYRIFSYDSNFVYSTYTAMSGTPAKSFPSCLGLYNAGNTSDGTYTIDPDGLGGEGPFQVVCDMLGGGWTKIPIGNGPGFGKSNTACTTNGDYNHGKMKYLLTDGQINALKAVSTESKQAVQYDYVDDDSGRIDLLGWGGAVAFTRYRNASPSCTLASASVTNLADAPIREVKTVDCNGDTYERCAWVINDAWLR